MNSLTNSSAPNDTVRLSLPVMILALVVTFLLGYFGIRWLVVNPVSNETIWYLVRSSGTVAYLFLTASTAWGLVLSSKLVKEMVPAPLTLAMHNYLSWNAIGLTAVHALLLLFSSHLDYTLFNLLVPFTGPYSPFWVGVGIIGLYLMLLTTITFYFRRQMGYKTFHAIHYLSYAAFFFSLLHSWLAGTDQGNLGPIYLVSGLLVFFLTTFRILEALRRPPTA